ncbi:MAG: iron-sulfur cluster assembly accessory protein [Gemmatimonadota bacterium]
MTESALMNLIEFTDRARDRILGFLQEEGEELAIRVGVADSSPIAPQYEMTLIQPDERTDEDQVYRLDGFEVVIDPVSAQMLEGTRVDWVENLQGSGFKFENPNLKPPGSEPLTGSLAERVQRVLDERINPGVAAHGGVVHLVDIRDDVAYLRMGGGCQGCGLASVTLSQGIKQILLQAVPEIRSVEDVTDHAAGANPYFQPSK